MSKKTIGSILLVGGVVLLAVSLAADYIGLGTYWGIDWAQLLGAGVGLLIAAFGYWFGFIWKGGRAAGR